MPAAPGPLTAVDRNVWTVEMDQTIHGAHMPTRMTVIRLTSGRLLLYSPVALNDALRTELAALGEVGAIVCPNVWHHLYAKAAVEAFPTARLYGPAELAPKRRDLHFDGYLTNVPPLMWGEDVLPGRVQGNALHETALFHPESKTLLVADLFVNVRAPRGLLAGLYLRFGGIKDAPGPHRFVRWSFRDKDEARGGIRRILKWDFTRIVPCHGEIVAEDAKAAFTQAYAWLEL